MDEPVVNKTVEPINKQSQPADEPVKEKMFTQDELNTFMAKQKHDIEAKYAPKDPPKEEPSKEEPSKEQKEPEEPNKELEELKQELLQYKSKDEAIQAGVVAAKAGEFIKLALAIGEGEDTAAKIADTLAKYPFYKEEVKASPVPKVPFGGKTGGEGGQTEEQIMDRIMKDAMKLR